MANVEFFVFATISALFSYMLLFNPKIEIATASGVLSIISWYETGMWFMASNPDKLEFGYYFIALAIISLPITIYAGLQLLDPYRKEDTVFDYE